MSFTSEACIPCNNIFSANRWQYKTVMKIELLMNPLEHFHDNSHNNFNEFTSHLLCTKSEYNACVMDFGADSLHHYSHHIIRIYTSLRTVTALPPY